MLLDTTAVTKAPFPIPYEDNHLLVVDKPPQLVTMGAPVGTASLIEQARDYIGRKYEKPGKVYLGIVSRLDAPVSGALVIARTSKAASRLTEQFRLGTVVKKYWALVEEVPQNNPYCYNLPCPSDVAVAEEINCQRATALARIVEEAIEL